MSAHTKPYYQGIGIPDHRVTGLWTDEMSYTEAGPRPGIPVPDDGIVTAAALECSGTLDASTTYDFYCARGGHAGEARWVWRKDGDTNYRGHVPPFSILHWEMIETTGTIPTNRGAHIVTLHDDQVLAAWHTDVGSTTTIECSRMALDGTWGSAVEIDEVGQPGSSNMPYPCLVPIPDQDLARTLCFYWTFDTANSTAQIAMKYSDDGGDTWTVGSRQCLPAALSTSTSAQRRIRAAYKDGQILLIVHATASSGTYRDALTQYASTNEGVTFTLIEAQDASNDDNSDGYPDVVVAGGHFVVGFADKTNNRGVVVRVASAFDSIFDETPVDVAEAVVTESGSVFVDGDFCLVVDDLDAVYAYWRQLGDADQLSGAASLDGGVTWVDDYDTINYPIAEMTNGDVLRHLAACWQRGRAVLAHNFNSDLSTDENVCVAFLGSWSTVTWPTSAAFAGYAPLTARYLPISLPQNCGWSASGTASTETMVETDGGYCDLHTSSNVRHYSRAATGNLAVALLTLRVTAGSAGLYVELDDTSAHGYILFVDLAATTITMYTDSGPYTQLQQDTGLSSGATTQILAAVDLDTGEGLALYRTDPTNPDAEWTMLGEGESLTDTGGGGNQIVRMGVIQSGTTECEIVLEADHLDDVLPSIAAGISNPGDLLGRVLKAGRATYIDGGMSLQQANGPAYEGDTFTVAPRHDYPVTNLLHWLSPSPEDTWRSTQVAADESVAWELSSLDSLTPNTLLAIPLRNCNTWDVRLERRSSGSWSQLWNDSLRIPIAYEREGDSLVITEYNTTQGGGEGVYVYPNEWVGGAITLDDGNTRRITWNSSGLFGPASGTTRAAVKQPRIYCSDMTGSEDAAGDGYLWVPNATIFWWFATGSPPDITGLRLVFKSTSPTPPEGYFECGFATPFWVTLFGTPWENNRTIIRTPRVDAFRTPDGRRRDRKRGPTGRVLELDWSGVHTRQLFEGGDDDTLKGGDVSGLPVNTLRREAPFVMDWLHSMANSPDTPDTPVLVLPYITPHLVDLSATRWPNGQEGAYFDAAGSFVGRFVGEMRLQATGTPKGAELVSEMLQLRATLEELV